MPSSGRKPGGKLASSQALKQTNRGFEPASQRLKLQARVHKLQYPRAWVQANLPLVRGTSNKSQATSYWRLDRYKPQATSSESQAAGILYPSDTRSKIQVPGNNLQEPWLGFLASIKLLNGCFTWNAIWCGEKRILLPDVTFSSTVKNLPELL